MFLQKTSLKIFDFDNFNASSIEEELIICNKYKPYHITYRRGGGIETYSYFKNYTKIISERDMATLSEEENVEISNKLNSNSTGYLGYEQDKTA